jgi:uncharacterized membrane protein YjjB (DUF3815 family)
MKASRQRGFFMPAALSAQGFSSGTWLWRHPAVSILVAKLIPMVPGIGAGYTWRCFQ